MAVLGIEDWLEMRGWDLPPVALALVDNRRAPGEHGLSERARHLEYEVLGEGDPYEVLAAADCSCAEAVVVSAEAWSVTRTGVPADSSGSRREERLVRPSCRPDRVEVRSVLMVCRDGSVLTVIRPRGGTRIVEASGDGPLVMAMRTALAGAR